jgi:hypothetical protein
MIEPVGSLGVLRRHHTGRIHDPQSGRAAAYTSQSGAAPADLERLVVDGRGDVPLKDLRLRCSNCRGSMTEFVVTAREDYLRRDEERPPLVGERRPGGGNRGVPSPMGSEGRNILFRTPISPVHQRIVNHTLVNRG